jgi:hypothetical protein
MKTLQRMSIVIIHTVIVTSLTFARVGCFSQAASAPIATQSIIQDWWTISYGPEETEYVVRLALASGSIGGPLDPNTHDSQLQAMAAFEVGTGLRVADPELERRIVSLAQNQALMESDSTWKADPWVIETEGILYSRQDREGFPFTLIMSQYLDEYYRNLLVDWFGQTQDFGQRSRLYRDVARMLVYPYIDADEDLQAIEAAFDRDFGEQFDAAVEQMEPFPVGDAIAIGQWFTKLLQTFTLYVKASQLGQDHVEAVNCFGKWLTAGSLILTFVNLNITREEAIALAKTVAQVSAQSSYYSELRMEALESIVEENSWDFAAEWGLTLLRTEMNAVTEEDIQYYWQQWLDENDYKCLLTIAGVAMGAAKLAGAAITTPVSAIFIAVWVVSHAWFFVDGQADTAVSSAIALTFEHYIRTHMDNDLGAGCSGNTVERALLLNNMRYRAASLYYRFLYDKYDSFFDKIGICYVPQWVKDNWLVYRDAYAQRVSLTLPPTYLIRLEAVHDGADTPEEVEAYADWFVQKIQSLDHLLEPSVVKHGVSPTYGSYTTEFFFEATYRSLAPTAPDEAYVVVDGHNHALTPTAVETYDSVVYYHTLEYAASGFTVGEHDFYFDIGEAEPTSDETFEVSSDPRLGDPTISIVSPVNGRTVSGRVDIEAWTLTGDIQEVRIYVNNLLNCVDEERPWECSWNTDSSFSRNGPAELLAVARDASGKTASDSITVQVFNSVHNEPPSIEVLTPDSDAAYGRFSIKWEDEDLDDPARISLYYDDNSSGYDGTLIIDYISEEWTSDWWSWDISSLPSGNSYWVYAEIDDGVNPPVYDYSPGPLTIQAPTVADHFEVDHVIVGGDSFPSGDGDGVPDAGEALDYRIYIRNKSGQRRCYTKGELTTSTPGVEITDAKVNYQSPTPGQVTRGTGDFDFQTISTFDGTIDFTLRLISSDCSTGDKYVDTESLSYQIHPDDTTTPTITSGPTVSQITPASAVVSWTTDEPSDSVVEYGLTPGYGSQTSVPDEVTTTHEVHLVGLHGGMPYYFRVNSTDPSGNGPIQATGSFTTTNIGDGLHVEDIIYPVFDSIKGLTWDGSYLWVLHQEPNEFFRIYQYDPASQSILSFFDVDFIPEPDTGACGLAWDGSYLWMANTSTEDLYRVDTSGTVIATVPVSLEDPCGLAWGDGSLWVSDLEYPVIQRMTIAGTVLDSFPAPSAIPRELAWGQGHLWVADSNANQIFEISAAGDFIDLYPAYGSPRGLAFAGTDHLWEALGTSPLDRLLYIETVEDTVSPVVGTPTVLGTSSGAAYLQWTSDEPTYGYVNYGLTTAYGYTVTLSTPAMTHTTPIVGLDPNQTYHFRVGGRDLPGNDTTWSGDHNFTTSAETEYNVRNFFRVPGMRGWRIDGITWDGTRLRAMDGYLDHVLTLEPEDGRVVDLMIWQQPDRAPEDIAWENGYLWIADRDSNPEYLYRVDPSTGANSRALEWPESRPRGITWDGSNLWVGTSSTIYRVHPTTGALLGSFSVPPGTNGGALTWDGTHLWMVDQAENGSVYRLTTAGTVVDSFNPPFAFIRGVAWDGSYIWVTDNQAEVIYQIDPAVTTEPVVARVLSEDIDQGYDYEFYPAGSRVCITAYEQYDRVGMTATLSISSTVDDPGIRDTLMTDNGDGSYSYIWHTAGQATTVDYEVEVRLTDGTSTDGDGLSRTPDLRINLAKDYSISHTISVPTEWSLRGLTWAGNDLWVSRNDNDGRIAHVDVDTGLSSFEFAAPLHGGDQGPQGLDWDGSYLWLANRYPDGARNVTRHTTGGGLVGTITLSGVDGLQDLALQDSSMWSPDENRLFINRFSTGGGAPNLQLVSPCYNPHGLEWDGSYLWLSDSTNHHLYVMETDGDLVDHYVQPWLDDIAFHDGELWGIDEGTDHVYHLVLKSDLALELLAPATGSTPQGVAVGITATVHATNVPAEDAVLRFYDGDPDSGGTQIGSDYNLGTVTPGTPETVVLSWSAYPLGLYDIYARIDPADAIDEGNESNNTVQTTLVVYDLDPDPPAITNVAITEEGGDSDGNLEDDEQIRFAWVAFDPGSGISVTAVTIGGSTYPASGSYYAVVGPLATDFYTYTVRATDNSSETQLYDGELVVVPHSVQVTGTLPLPDATNVHVSDPIGVHFETSIAPDGLTPDMVQMVSQDGATVTGRVAYDALLGLATFVPFAELDNNTTYTVTILAGLDGPVDEYSNTLESPHVWSFVTEPDTTLPVAVLGGPEPGFTYNGSLGVFGSALDKNLDEYLIQYGAGMTPITWTTAAAYSSPVANGYLGSWSTDVVSDGLYTIRLVVSDTVGLTASDTLTVQVDNTPPTLPDDLHSTSHLTAMWTNQTVITVTWSPVTDTFSGVAGYAVSWDAWADGQPEPVVDLSPMTTTVASPPLADGDAWYFTLIGCDGVGNWSAPARLGPFYIDTMPPSSAVIGLPETSDTLTVTVCWDGEDTGAGIASYDIWVRDGTPGTWTQWLSGVTQTCADFIGENGHTYYFESRAWDNAGNAETLGQGDGDTHTTIHKGFEVFLPLI